MTQLFKLHFSVFVLLLALLASAQMFAQTKFSSKDSPSMSVAIVTTDWEASQHFYIELLGFVNSGAYTIDEKFASQTGLSRGLAFEVITLHREGQEGGAEIKLLRLEEMEKTESSDVIESRAGMRYLTLQVESFDKILDRLQEGNIPFLGETPLELPDGRRFLLVRDPDGVLIEIIGN